MKEPSAKPLKKPVTSSSDHTYTLICGPSPFASLATWESFLAEMRTYPASNLQAQDAIKEARETIRLKKQGRLSSASN